ncbi:MAG TPA: DUF554 domain-containing protein [Actinobacteria bacterium]|nr:DUF554 domain-containing protein [Actinomycetota bacterium]
MIGLGTFINVLAILVGAAAGVFIGHRLPERTRITVTDGLGLITLIIGALNVVAITDVAFTDVVGSSWTLLVVLGAVVIGGVIGSLLRIEGRLESFAAWLQSRLSRDSSSQARERFIEGFVTSSLLFCIGPLAILGSLSDGLGDGIEQLSLKSSLDFFAALAFAATLGWGVAMSAIPVGIWQGFLTVMGVAAGAFLPDALIASITATGGVLLLGIGLRLLQIRQVAVGDFLPALVVAPLLTSLFLL